MAGRGVLFLPPSLALAACGNDASGRLTIADMHGLNESAAPGTEIGAGDAEEPTAPAGAASGLGVATGLLGVGVLDALGRLAAFYPTLDDDSPIPEMFGAHVAPDEGFEVLATDLGMNLGARITFDPAYDPNEPHTFVAVSRFGNLLIRSMRVNALDPKSWERLTASTVLQRDPGAPAHGSILHANPDCFVRGTHWGTESYNDGELMLRAAPRSNAPDAGEPYELRLFISDSAERCR